MRLWLSGLDVDAARLCSACFVACDDGPDNRDDDLTTKNKLILIEEKNSNLLKSFNFGNKI